MRRRHRTNTAVTCTRQVVLIFRTLAIIVRTSAATGPARHFSQSVLIPDAPHDHEGVAEVLVALA